MPSLLYLSIYQASIHLFIYNIIGAPLLPDFIRGSISHKDRLVAAVARFNSHSYNTNISITTIIDDKSGKSSSTSDYNHSGNHIKKL